MVIAPPELGVPVWMPFRRELLELAERHAPRDVAGVGVDGDQLAPRRLRAAPALRRIPEPSALGRDLAHGRRRIRVAAAARGAGAASSGGPSPGAAAAPSAGLQMSPLARGHHVRDDQAERLVEGRAVPVAAALRAGEHEDVLADAPRIVGHGVLELVLVPQRLAERLVLRRHLRQLGPLQRIARQRRRLDRERLRRRRPLAGRAGLRHLALLDAEDRLAGFAVEDEQQRHLRLLRHRGDRPPAAADVDRGSGAAARS